MDSLPPPLPAPSLFLPPSPSFPPPPSLPSSFPSYTLFFFVRGKTITSACLSKLAGHFYIGTESGNVYTLDVRLFMLKDDVIKWTNATAL